MGAFPNEESTSIFNCFVGGVSHFEQEATRKRTMTDQNPATGNRCGATGPEHSGDIHAIIDSLPTQVAYKDHADRFLFVNKVFCDVLGKPRHELLGGGMWSDLFPPEQARRLREWDLRVMESGEPAGIIHQVNLNGDRKWVRIDRAPYFDAKGNIIGTVGSAIEVTSLIRSQPASCRPLDPIIPIYAVCKKIRDEAGEWHHLESYISSRTEAQFTHGYCPECADKISRNTHPRSMTCDVCGSKLTMTRFADRGKRYRRYSCPECGYSQDFVRQDIEE